MRTTVLLVLALLVQALPLSAVSKPLAPAPMLSWHEVSRVPHDTSAFTQGLHIDPLGRMFESTGGWGDSSLREVDRVDGRVLRSRALPDALFGEGLTQVNDALVQLTWKAGLALVWDADTFDLEDVHRYEGQGWGLCHDGERLVMSDGSSTLTFRDPHTFEVIGAVRVALDEVPLEDLNELECVGDVVWANVWHSDWIARIDPDDGRVTGWLDLQALLDPHPAEADRSAVLNGIAWDDAAGTLWLTGKNWPEMIEIRVLDDEV